MSKKCGFLSKIMTSLTGVQNDTEKGGDAVVAESSSGVKVTSTTTGTFINPPPVTATTGAYVDEISAVANATTIPCDGLPNKRRKLYTEEKKKEDERKYQIEININEWKKSLKNGYEFDHLEVWPIPENESRCATLPENHPSTKTMCV
jgi:hypothetical protein